MNTICSIRLALAAMLLLMLAGCEELDPQRRTDVWYPTGSNAANIAAMVANPNDLIHGRGSRYGDGTEATLAVDRLWIDKTKQLPVVNDSNGNSSGGGGGGSAGGSGGSGSGGGG